MNGYGEFHDFNSDTIYIGFFEDNLYNGFGILRNFKENYIYIGEWKNNQRDGVARVFKGKLEDFGKYKNNIKIMNFDLKLDILNSINIANLYLKDFFILKNYEEINRFTRKKRIMEI
jgi:hypothetical protein